MWFASSLRGNKNVIAHYLDGIKGCGEAVEEQIRINFFVIIYEIINKITQFDMIDDLEAILQSLKWKFQARDHVGLKYIDIFSLLFNNKNKLISEVWGLPVNIKLQKTEISKSLQETILSSFEHIFLQVIGRIIKKEDSSLKIIPQTTLKLER